MRLNLAFHLILALGIFQCQVQACDYDDSECEIEFDEEMDDEEIDEFVYWHFNHRQARGFPRFTIIKKEVQGATGVTHESPKGMNGDKER